MKYSQLSCLALLTLALLCGCDKKKKEAQETTPADSIATENQMVELPAPYATKSAERFSKIIGWPEGKTPGAPEGFIVTKFASALQNPRWIYIAPNGDILVAEASTEKKVVQKVVDEVKGKTKAEAIGGSANRITLFRDVNNDGKPEIKETFLSGLNRPFGMLIIGNAFYVANTDGLLKYPYKTGSTSIKEKGVKILDLPAGGYNNHWTRNIIANEDGSKIYLSVGSGSNAGENGLENEIRRACILEINPDGSGERIFASGLRNPVGMDWVPGTGILWTAVNERDALGDDLVPDYITSVQEKGFYGWPYTYFGEHQDTRVKEKRPDSLKNVIVPDLALDPHSASLGLTFYDQKIFPGKYHNGAFIGQHGSWNRSQFTGYKVVFVPFKNEKPSGKPEDFLTGFIADESKSEVYGRPVGVAITKGGALLVADDVANTIWMVSAKK